MAINFLNKVDFNQNELDKARLVNEANDTAAGTPVDGQLYYDTTDNVVKVGEGGVWVSISGDITALSPGTYININNPNGPIPTINHDLTTRTDTTSASSPGSAGTFTTVDSVTTNSTGHISALNLKTITLPTSDNYVSWTLDGDSGTSQTILSGNTATFIGGTKISTVVSATDNLTITHDATTRTNTTSAATANVFTVIDSIGSDSTGHITGANTKTITVPDNNTTYTLPTTNGNNPDIVLTGTDGSTDIVNMNGVGTTVKVTGSTLDTITFDLVDDVEIITSLVVNSGGASTRSSFGYQVTIPETPLADSDAASKKYVDDLVAGGLTFLGTFRADTGEILSGTNSGLYLYQVPGGAGTRVAVVVGDYYVVATAGGDFYANTSYPLDIGDSIIGVAAAAADASVVTDWSLVSQGVTVNSFTNANGTYISSSVPVNTNATGAVTIGTLDLSAVDGTSDVNTKFLSKDNTWDVPSYTTNTDAKYALTAEPKSGTSVPLTLTGSDGGSTTIVDLTEGANITLTRTSATEITIASTDTGALGKNILLNTSDAWVSSSTAGGVTTFAVDVSNANVFNGTVGAVNVKCEVIDAATSGANAGQTVYADITRGVNAGGATFGLQSLNISFTGTPASSAYRVLLTYIG